MTSSAAGDVAPAGVAPGGVPRPGAGGWSAGTLLNLVVSETRKTLSTAAWWALLVSAGLLSALVTLVTAEAGGLAFTPSLAQAIALGSFAAKFAVVFGVVCASGEYRHRTITTSYLTAAGRPQLLVAKVVLAAVMGAVYAVVAALLGLLGMLIGGATVSGTDLNALLEVSAAAILVLALWAVLGVGLGTLINNQLAAIVSVLVYLLLVEQIISGLAALSDLGRIDDYLPGGAASTALTGLSGEGLFGGFSGMTLPWWVALLIFLGYAVVAVLAGAAGAQRRDIT